MTTLEEVEPAASGITVRFYPPRLDSVSIARLMRFTENPGHLSSRVRHCIVATLGTELQRRSADPPAESSLPIIDVATWNNGELSNALILTLALTEARYMPPAAAAFLAALHHAIATASAARLQAIHRRQCEVDTRTVRRGAGDFPTSPAPF